MHREFERILRLIDSATEGLPPEQLGWHPAEGKWSAGDILEHLSRAFGGTAKAFSRLSETGNPTKCRKPTMKEVVGAIVVTKIGYLPEGRKAPDGVRPRGIDPRQALAEIKENLRAMDQAVAACEARLGNRGKVLEHPILGPLTISEWRRFHFVHTRHHMRQIQTIRGKMPAAAS